MMYSESEAKYSKGMTLITGTNIRRAQNFRVGYVFAGLDKETIAFIQRRQEEKRLQHQQKKLLKITNHINNIANHGYAYIEASKPKRR